MPIPRGPNKGKTSSASGKYQFLKGTWDEAKKALDLPDFSPQSQDRAAWWLAQRDYHDRTGKNLLTALRSGDAATLAKVGTTLAKTWTSLPHGIEASTNENRFVATFKSQLPKFQSTNRNLTDQRAEQQALRNQKTPPLPRERPGDAPKAPEIYTAPSGNKYKVGDVFTSGKPGSFIYTVTKDGFQHTRIPTGEKTILGGYIADAVKKKGAEVVKAAGDQIGQMGTDLASTGKSLLEYTGVGTILGGIGNFFSGTPAKPTQAELNANMKNRGQPASPLVVPDIPGKVPVGTTATGVPQGAGNAGSPSGFGVGPKPSVLVPGATGPAMPRGALAARRAASEASRLALAEAEEKQAAAARTVSWLGSQQKIEAAAAAQARLTMARAAQEAARRATKLAAATLRPPLVQNVPVVRRTTLGQRTGTEGLAAYSGQSGASLMGADASSGGQQDTYFSVAAWRAAGSPPGARVLG